MNLFLIRHLESEKNINDSFSNMNNDEKLTNKGREDAYKLGVSLSSLVTENKLDVKNIYVSNSVRAIESCKSFAQDIHANIKPYDELVSAKKDFLGGVSQKKAQKLYPEYMFQYELYRKGLFNVYNLLQIGGKEDKRLYENKVIYCLNKIVSISDESSKFVFLHRSSMTAILIYFARKYYQYPQDFYGYIPINFGHVYWLRKEDNKWEFKALNCPYWKLGEIFK